MLIESQARQNKAQPTASAEATAAAEAVRLIIWDLDDTFWKGTITEGGISEYVQEHHDMVIELAHRGIISSICSKNDMKATLEFLESKGIRDYFVFPSISWDPKGARLAALVEAVQLRPASVMFIDDNPNNRAEAAAFVPGLQIEDEGFLPFLLSDPRFKGKDDSGLTRLRQYQLLETRKSDEERAAGSNEDFLRSCDVRVCIEYDVLSHMDRAIELINRTNQLNYTKKRLPENQAEARKMFAAGFNAFNRQAGLVRVADKYGDYGFVGYFETQNGRREIVPGAAITTLRHYCFSCRTLGMLIEQWLYEYLGRPQLDVVGDVLTDLSVPRVVDWVRLVPTIDDPAAQQTLAAPAIVVGGGCESNTVGDFLRPYAERVDIFGNYAASGLFAHFDSAMFMADICRRDIEMYRPEAAILGLPLHMTANDFIGNAPPGTAFILNFSRDAASIKVYQHKIHKWRFWVEPSTTGELNLVEASEEALVARLDERARESTSAGMNEQLIRAARHLRENYDSVVFDEAERVRSIHWIIDRMPPGCKLIMTTYHDEMRLKNREIRPLPYMTRFTQLLREIAAAYPFVGVVSFAEAVTNHDELLPGGNHYSRPVFVRFIQRVLEVLGGLGAKA